MMHRAVRIVSRVPVITAVLACLAAVCVQDACVLAEPSGALPRLPDARPTIVHASVVPPTSAVLTTLPTDTAFLVPVELIDPTAEIAYAAFVDYNPSTGAGLITSPPGHSEFEVANTTGRTRLLTVPITPPDTSPSQQIDLNRCHVIEIVVALRFDSESNPFSIHTPGPPGGDIVTWFYNPSGDLGGCPSLAIDGGVDAKADSEAGEGGIQ